MIGANSEEVLQFTKFSKFTNRSITHQRHAENSVIENEHIDIVLEENHKQSGPKEAMEGNKENNIY